MSEREREGEREITCIPISLARTPGVYLQGLGEGGHGGHLQLNTVDRGWGEEGAWEGKVQKILLHFVSPHTNIVLKTHKYSLTRRSENTQILPHPSS